MAVKLAPSVAEIYQYLKSLRINVDVKKDFVGQVQQIDSLFSNDKTGLVSTIVDFMIHSATVDFKIETSNPTLNEALQNWQTKILNRNVNIDIPGGLRSLTTENYRERWRSSLLALKVIWGEEKFGNQGSFILPKKMWFLDGSAITVEETGALNTRKYFLTFDKKKEELKNTTSESIFIRKPYTAWHKSTVVPYLVRRGTMFNALMKMAIVQKQSDVIEAIMPILLKLSAGTDSLVQEGLGVTEEQFKELKDKIVSAKDKFEEEGNFGDLIASLRHDVHLDYIIPELGKIFDEKIVKSTDRNLLSSLGLIELQGFSSTRQEAILNPKVMVEEVTDAVMDWANLLEDVMLDMLERNKVSHKNLVNGKIEVIPGLIKAFITDEMRTMLRALYDRGIISKQNASEDIGNLNFEVQVQRRQKEEERNLQDTMKPPVIQNLEQYEDVETTDNPDLEDENKKPNTPEADNFNNAILQHYGKQGKKKTKKRLMVRCKKCNYKFDYANTPEAGMGYVKCENCETPIDQDGNFYAIKDEIIAPYQNIDELPDNVKNPLPIPAQLLWMRVFNSILKETGDEDRARSGAWSKVKELYEKVSDDKKWIKKASLEDYKEEMSAYTYKLFTEMYNTSISHNATHTNALNTALAIVERVCVKNTDDVWVKNKSLTKEQIEKLDKPDYVSHILDLELKEKKLKLIDKLLNGEK